MTYTQVLGIFMSTILINFCDVCSPQTIKLAYYTPEEINQYCPLLGEAYFIVTEDYIEHRICPYRHSQTNKELSTEKS